jgi:hypothetical protein
MRSYGRSSGEQRRKQAGRQEAKAHGRIARKSKVVASFGRNGDLWLDLPDERGHQVINSEELADA